MEIPPPRHHGLFVFFILTVVMLSLSHRGDAAATDAEQKSLQQTLTVGTTNLDIKQLIDINPVPGKSSFIRNFISPPLVYLDENWRWKCFVCVKIPTIKPREPETKKDKGAEKKPVSKELITDWEIAGSFNWADGTAVTGYDVIYTLNQMKLSLADPVAIASFPAREITVDSQNPRKFRIIFHTTNVDFYQLLAVSLLPAHQKELLTPTQTSEAGTVPASLLPAAYTSMTFYYGPYRVSSADASAIELVRNPNYKGQQPAFDRIVVKKFTKPTESLQALASGKIHMIPDGELTLEDLKSVDGQSSKNIKILSAASADLEQITLNLRNPVFADINLRQALAHSIDRDKIIKNVMGGYALKAEQFLNPKDPYYTLPSQAYNFNRQTAGDILTEAGWKITPSGYREKNQRRLSINITVRNEPLQIKLAQSIREDWEKLGINVAVEEITDKIGFIDYLRKARFKDSVIFSWALQPGSFPWQAFHSSEIPTSQNDYTGKNMAGWVNRDVDSALKTLVINPDPAERKEILSEIQDTFLNELPMIPLFFRFKFAATSLDLVDVVIPGHNFHSSLYATSWHFISSVDEKKPPVVVSPSIK